MKRGKVCQNPHDPSLWVGGDSLSVESGRLHVPELDEWKDVNHMPNCPIHGTPGLEGT
jgi:hypothetical protein